MTIVEIGIFAGGGLLVVYLLTLAALMDMNGR
jgi:hypothetical protein